MSRRWRQDAYRRDEREAIALSDLQGSILAQIIDQVNMPLVGHHVFFGRMNHRVCHSHDDHCHQAWPPPGPGHLQPRPHGQRPETEPPTRFRSVRPNWTGKTNTGDSQQLTDVTVKRLSQKRETRSLAEWHRAAPCQLLLLLLLRLPGTMIF